MILNELTRLELVKMSKDNGFNRYSRRMTINKNEISIDKIVIGRVLTNYDHLDVYFTIRSYTCSIRLVNFMRRVRLLNSESKYSTNLRNILTLAMKQTLSNNDLLMNCTCPDFYYRFSYSATINGYGLNTNQLIPAKITNPNNRGSGCKHLIRLINAPYLWKNKVISLVLNVLNDDDSLLSL